MTWWINGISDHLSSKFQKICVRTVADLGFIWGGANFQSVCANLLCWKFYAENYIKWKNLEPKGARVPGAPPRSASAEARTMLKIEHRRSNYAGIMLKFSARINSECVNNLTCEVSIRDLDRIQSTFNLGSIHTKRLRKQKLRFSLTLSLHRSNKMQCSMCTEWRQTSKQISLSIS